MPRGVAPRALLGLVALIIAIAVAFVPLVDARPKDKDNGNKRGDVAVEAVPPDDAGQPESPPVEIAPDVEQPLTANEGNAVADERTLISSDADGDYIPDSLDNCANIQNPDQADADGDGHGDACPVYQDADGDTIPDKSDNCPNIATSDFSDNDGDGVGNPCDKSPDGIEPEPEPVPELNGRGGPGEAEPAAPENGEDQNGTEIERASRSRSKQRERTDTEKATITTGVDGEPAADQPAQDEQTAEEPVRDNPRRNEELIAEAAASGELYAPPEPPPAAQKAWDESEESTLDWDPVVRIDAGATDDLQPAAAADREPNDARSRDAESGDTGAARSGDVADSEFARGWVRAKLLLQQEIQDDAGDGDPGSGDALADEAPAPVPVESGLVITGVEVEPPSSDTQDPATEPGDTAAAPGARDADQQDAGNGRPNNDNSRNRNQRGSGQDGSRRDGSSRGPAAPDRQQAGRANPGPGEERGDNGGNQRGNRDAGRAGDWNDDQFFEGGSALNWAADIGVAGTDDDTLYLTQRSGSGTGKRRGFSYAIPVEGNGTYMVRLYFAEPYWGAPGGPEGEEGRRVFSVDAEGKSLLDDLDVYAEVGSLTALVKQAEVEVTDGELNLRFTAAEGEPIVAAIEILQPAG